MHQFKQRNKVQFLLEKCRANLLYLGLYYYLSTPFRCHIFQLPVISTVWSHTCVNDDVMGGSFNQPDVTAVTFVIIHFPNQIQPIIYLLWMEPVTTSSLKKQQLSSSLNLLGVVEGVWPPYKSLLP